VIKELITMSYGKFVVWDDDERVPRLGRRTPTKLPTEPLDDNNGYGLINVQLVQARKEGDEGYVDITSFNSLDEAELKSDFPKGGVFKVPIFVLQGSDDYDDAYKDFAQFARMGVILGISKKYWDQTLKRRGKGAKLARRELFRPITSHNDKLGVDYDLKGKRYVAQYPAGKQFNVS